MTGAPSRPRSVDAAYWVWVLGAVGLVVVGLLSATASREAVRADLAADGVAPETIDSFLLLLVVQGALLAAGGLAVGLLAGGVRRGDPRFRRAQLTLSVALVAVVLLFTVAGLGAPLALLAVVLLLVASGLVLRRPAREWFDHVAGDPVRP